MVGVVSNPWRFDNLPSQDDEESPFLVEYHMELEMYLLDRFGVIDTTRAELDQDQQTPVSFHHRTIVSVCCLE